ncbi:MAG: M48 family peptidase [Desulfobulbus sp.]|nr:MAG: M48 family peptidase [Desulfobulbus sp.]
MNSYLIFILAVILLGFLLEAGASLLNLRALDPRLPEEFTDVFDRERYARSQEYTRATTRFGLLREGVATLLTVAFLLAGGFNWADTLARSFGFGSIGTGLIFSGLLLLLSGLTGLPFSLYATFVIEERFGFNRTTVRTFVLDLAKIVLLALLLGAPLLAFILWFFEKSGPLAWLYCWLAVIAWTVLLQFLAPALIMPLFNTFTPLADGELKERITAYARGQNFRMQGIFTMDGSKRSTRLNAFFSGFGSFRRIVFFDTLLEKLSPGEIVAVLAHEMGHYRLRHVFIMLAVAVAQTGIMFALLSRFINNPGLFAAFRMEHLSIYASLIFFGFLFAPVSLILGIAVNGLSRQHEYRADAYGAATTGRPQDLISALKKLAAANMANLTPHPLHVLLHAGHPPVLARIRALAAIKTPNLDMECVQCRRRFPAEHLTGSGRETVCRDCRAEIESCGCADD